MGLLKEFKTFINQGNVVDLAVGVVIGAAFGKIVSSFVDDIISPIIGLLVGETNFGNLKYVMKQAVMGADGKETTPAVSLNYGSFLEAVLDFIIVAAAIFMVVKAMNNMKKKEAEAPAAPVAPHAQEVLLMQIRDLLKK
jgi:large conductance mechanosensitive channel